MRQLACNETLLLEVNPRDRLVSTGLRLQPGERYNFSAGGSWLDWKTKCGPEGWRGGWKERFCRVPRQPFFLLCGAVGRDDRHTFPIGAGRQWEVPADVAELDDYQLYLFANDWPFMYFNNHPLGPDQGGPLWVNITRLA